MKLLEKCRVINFKEFGDARGKLVVIENSKDIPFDIKRIFYIYNSDSESIRGCHANRNSEFVLINVSGRSEIKVDDGKDSLKIVLDEPMKGIYIPKMLWKEMYNFTKDSVLLCLTNTFYDSSEYIRDYKKYLIEMKHNEQI